MTLIVRCRACDREFEPSAESVRRGDWHTCPACQDDVSQEQERPA